MYLKNWTFIFTKKRGFFFRENKFFWKILIYLCSFLFLRDDGLFDRDLRRFLGDLEREVDRLRLEADPDPEDWSSSSSSASESSSTCICRSSWRNFSLSTRFFSSSASSSWNKTFFGKPCLDMQLRRHFRICTKSC